MVFHRESCVWLLQYSRQTWHRYSEIHASLERVDQVLNYCTGIKVQIRRLPRGGSYGAVKCRPMMGGSNPILNRHQLVPSVVQSTFSIQLIYVHQSHLLAMCQLSKVQGDARHHTTAPVRGPPAARIAVSCWPPLVAVAAVQRPASLHVAALRCRSAALGDRRRQAVRNIRSPGSSGPPPRIDVMECVSRLNRSMR